MDPLKRHWTTLAGQAAGHPAAFVVVIVYALLWLTFDRSSFDWNSIATLAVFVMTLFIQRANRRDTLALHGKLDEQEPEVIERHRDEELRKARPEPEAVR